MDPIADFLADDDTSGAEVRFLYDVLLASIAGLVAAGAKPHDVFHRAKAYTESIYADYCNESEKPEVFN
jgi:hypothetical protein